MPFIRRIRYNSPVVITFTLITLAALILDQVTDGAMNMLLFSVYRSSPKNPLTYVRLFTHVLGHSSVEHWAGNMTVFLLIGPMLEERYGSRKLLVMILIVAFLTGIVNVIFFPRTALLGASGIVFMMIVLASIVSVGKGEIPLTFILVAILYLGQEVYDGIFTSDNISQLTHLIGAFSGGVFGFALDRRNGSR